MSLGSAVEAGSCFSSGRAGLGGRYGESVSVSVSVTAGRRRGWWPEEEGVQTRGGEPVGDGGWMQLHGGSRDHGQVQASPPLLLNAAARQRTSTSSYGSRTDPNDEARCSHPFPAGCAQRGFAFALPSWVTRMANSSTRTPSSMSGCTSTGRRYASSYMMVLPKSCVPTPSLK